MRATQPIVSSIVLGANEAQAQSFSAHAALTAFAQAVALEGEAVRFAWMDGRPVDLGHRTSALASTLRRGLR